MSMGIAEYIALFLIGLLVVANLLHPGGWSLTILLILVVLALYAAANFFPEYILTTNQGKNATRQRKRRDRRARGLDPRTWFGRDRGGRRRQGGQQRQQPQNQQPRNGGENRRE